MTIPIHLKYDGCKTVIHQPKVEHTELDPETMSPLQKAVIQGFQYRDMLESGKVAAAGLDVVSAEPIAGDNPLLKAKNCIITPHIAWAAKESRQRILDVTADNIRSFLAGEPKNVVNP